MQSSPRIDELRQKFHENPRRYFAPLANEYRKAGDPEQAIAICRAHLAQQPGHMSGHVVYGQALYDAARMDEAAVVFHQALALDPENIIVLRHLGDIARQRGDVEEARSWYSRALDGDPHDAEIAAYLAELTEPLTTAPQAEPEERAVVPPEVQSESQPEGQAEPEPAQQSEPQAEPQTVSATEPQGETQSQAPSFDGAPAASDTTPAEEEEVVPETPAESAAVEEIALEDAESEGLAAEPPPATPETEPTPPSDSESDFGEWPESAIEPEPVVNLSDTEETHAPDESLISPYAREMELAAPSEMKWDLNESPYLELVESSASDDAWDSVRSDPHDSEQSPDAEPADAEEPAVSMEASNEAPPAPEPSESAAVADADIETAQPAPVAEAESEPPARKTPSRTTPVTESAPIVTRTLAELYLQQGYIEPALEIYRQLAEQEPGDRGLQARIEEISTDVESITEREEAEAALEPPVPEESVEDVAAAPIAAETTEGVDADTTVEAAPTAASEPPDELWDSADSWGDWPFTDAEDRDEIFGLSDDVAESANDAIEPARAADLHGAPPEAEPESEPGSEWEPEAEMQPEPEPEPAAEATREPEPEVTGTAIREPEPEPAPLVARRGVTVREFFATLGSARPPLRASEQPAAPWEAVAAATEPEPTEESGAPEEYPIADDAFANLFAGVPANAEDSRAAAVLSGAVAHGAPFSTPLLTPAPPPPRSAQQDRESSPPAQESEEDIRRFREWLDGLADS